VALTCARFTVKLGRLWLDEFQLFMIIASHADRSSGL
jgi:hypothetical protein